MRLGVLDVGSNTVHLLVVDAHHGAAPIPKTSVKSVLLAEQIDTRGEITREGADRLISTVADAVDSAAELECEDLMAFATSAVREASNVVEVLSRVHAETGVRLEVLAGEQEAILTFLAVRRWYGWSAGRLLMLDIGGGSLEIAIPDRVVATSKTFRSLARLTGAAPSSAGLRTRRILTDAGLRQVIAFISLMSAGDLAELEGVSASRSHQLVAGALVAQAAIDALRVGELDVCPWALREGVILRRLDWLARLDWLDEIDRTAQRRRRLPKHTGRIAARGAR